MSETTCYERWADNIFSDIMLKLCILVLATVSYVSSAGVGDANTFVDTIFREKMPFLVKGSPRLFPFATIADFKFKVYKNQITNRDLKGLNITFTSLAKGDTLIAIWKTIWVNVGVRDTMAQFEASAPINQGGTLRTFLLDDIKLDVTYDSDLSLNEGRREKFKEEIIVRVKDELRHIFYNDYKDLLRRAVESVTFPRI
ncbi:hypothetical protein MRX96_020102 [Rhipicephalus microplus]